MAVAKFRQAVLKFRQRLHYNRRLLFAFILFALMVQKKRKEQNV